MSSLENTEFKEDNTKQIYTKSETGKRQGKSTKYAKNAAMEAAIGRVQAKMPGPIARAIAGKIVILKYI